jgi:hypothetical protein
MLSNHITSIFAMLLARKAWRKHCSQCSHAQTGSTAVEKLESGGACCIYRCATVLLRAASIQFTTEEASPWSPQWKIPPRLSTCSCEAAIFERQSVLYTLYLCICCTVFAPIARQCACNLATVTCWCRRPFLVPRLCAATATTTVTHGDLTGANGVDLSLLQ